MGKGLPILISFILITSCTANKHIAKHPDQNYKHSANHKAGDSYSSQDGSIVTNHPSANYKSSFNKKKSAESDSVKITTPPDTVHPHNYKHQF